MDEFSVSRRALQLHFAKHGTAKGAKAAEFAAAVKREDFAKELPDHDLLVQRARDCRESAYENAVVIEELIMAQLRAAQKDPSLAVRAASAVKALSLAAAGLQRLHALKHTALGLDRGPIDGNELPSIVIRDLSKEELTAMTAEQADDVGELDHFEPGRPDVEAAAPCCEDEDDEIVVAEPAAANPGRSTQTDEIGCRYVRGASQ